MEMNKILARSWW